MFLALKDSEQFKPLISCSTICKRTFFSDYTISYKGICGSIPARCHLHHLYQYRYVKAFTLTQCSDNECSLHVLDRVWGAVQDIIHSSFLTHTHSPFTHIHSPFTYIYFHSLIHIQFSFHIHTFSFYIHIFSLSHTYILISHTYILLSCTYIFTLTHIFYFHTHTFSFHAHTFSFHTHLF